MTETPGNSDTAAGSKSKQRKRNKRESKTLIDAPLPLPGESLGKEESTPMDVVTDASGFAAASEVSDTPAEPNTTTESVPSRESNPTAGDSKTESTDPSKSDGDSEEKQRTSGIQNILNRRTEAKAKRQAMPTMMDQAIPTVEEITEGRALSKTTLFSADPEQPGEFAPEQSPGSESQTLPQTTEFEVTEFEVTDFQPTEAQAIEPEVRRREPSHTMIDYSVLDLIGQPLTATSSADTISVHAPAPQNASALSESTNFAPDNAAPSITSSSLGGSADWSTEAAKPDADGWNRGGTAEADGWTTTGTSGETALGHGDAQIAGEVEEWNDGTTVAENEQAAERVAVSRTRLDHVVLWETVEKSAAVVNQRISQEIHEKLSAPPKPQQPIVDFKLASRCPWKWDESETKERVRTCAKCQMQVYNFAGMEMPEAETLIFQRENKKKFTLFKREDGKFSTANCPVEKQRMQNLTMTIVAAVVLVTGLLVLLSYVASIQPKQKPAAAVSTDSTAAVATRSHSRKHTRRFHKDGTVENDAQNPSESSTANAESSSASGSTPSGGTASTNNQPVTRSLTPYGGPPGPPPGSAIGSPGSNNPSADDQYWDFPQGHGQ